MKNIKAENIIPTLSKSITNALYNVDSTTCEKIADAIKCESNSLSKWAMEQILTNNALASSTNSYACQDCGQAVLFVSVGQDIHIQGNLTDALNKAVEIAYTDARKSVADPILRNNTGTNTPCIIHYDIVAGDELNITFMSKGAGSENMSAVYMLTPSKGTDGIIDSVINTVVNAGANPCPPIIIGVGVGGTMETCALLSKKALTRKTGSLSNIKHISELEKQILDKVNNTKIGAQGFGGDTTCIGVAIETAPTHIGMLPVAVNIQCHSARHCTVKF